MANITDAPLLDTTGQDIAEKLDLISRRIGSGGSSGGGGTDDYADLLNKPKINGATLTGNKTGPQLGLQNELVFDDTPTENSSNPVKSGGVYNAINSIREVSASQAEDDWTEVFGEFSNYSSLIVNANGNTLDSNDVVYDD